MLIWLGVGGKCTHPSALNIGVLFYILNTHGSNSFRKSRHGRVRAMRGRESRERPAARRTEEYAGQGRVTKPQKGPAETEKAPPPLRERHRVPPLRYFLSRARPNDEDQARLEPPWYLPTQYPPSLPRPDDKDHAVDQRLDAKHHVPDGRRGASSRRGLGSRAGRRGSLADGAAGCRGSDNCGRGVEKLHEA
jgi:hypothetical protein